MGAVVGRGRSAQSRLALRGSGSASVGSGGPHFLISSSIAFPKAGIVSRDRFELPLGLAGRSDVAR